MEENTEAREETHPRSETANPYVIPVSILIAGGLIAGAVLYSNGWSTGSAPSGPQSAAVAGQAGTVSAKDLIDDDPAIGDPEASLTIVEFADFQCPFCARFFSTTEKQIIEQYVKTGKARLVYRDFPLTSIHPEAQKSAEASECADEQGKFWEFHDLLYQRQNALSLNNYKQWAKELGLNAGSFDQCLDSGKYAAEVQKDFSDGQAAGVGGTPATFVGDTFLSGALPFEDYPDGGATKPGFRSVIEAELKKLSE